MDSLRSSTWLTRAWLGPVLLVISSCAGTRYATPTDEQFRSFLSVPGNDSEYRGLVAFLRKEGVGDVVPVEHLLRQGTDWEKVHRTPFAIPPRELWNNAVQTLLVLRDFVIPLVGPVEVVSGYRTVAYNSVAGGAKRSKHLEFSAVDLLPLRETNRADLHAKLKAMWKEKGPDDEIGLGLYDHLRFHIDTGGYRTW